MFYRVIKPLGFPPWFDLHISDQISASFDLPSTVSCIVRDKSDDSQASLGLTSGVMSL